MTVDLSRYDLSNVQARAALDPIPSGWYNATITETTLKPTSAGDGQMMELALEISEGPYKGRKLWDRLNIQNPNQTAMEIAFATLKQIYNALGIVRANTSAELHGRPLKVKVKLRPAETGKDGKTYDAKNEVNGYDSINSDHAMASVAVVPGTAGAPQGVPAWAAGQAAPAPAAQPAAPAAATQPATMPTGKQPWETAAPPPVAAAAPAPAVVLTDNANGLSFQDFYSQGWNDDQLVEHGYAVRQAPTPAAPPAAPAAPGAPAAPPAATGTPGAPVPPWAQ